MTHCHIGIRNHQGRARAEIILLERFFELAWATRTPAASLVAKNLGELGLYRLRDDQVLDHIHAELVAYGLAPTHVLELLLEPPPPAQDAGECRRA